MQTFYFMDGRQKQIPIYASTTSKEAFEFLLQMIALKDNKGYIVYEVYKTINKDTQQADFVERSLLYSEILCDSLRKFEEFRIQCSQNPSLDVETYFLVKRKLFLNPRVLSSDPVEINLLYHQVPLLFSFIPLLRLLLRPSPFPLLPSFFPLLPFSPPPSPFCYFLFLLIPCRTFFFSLSLYSLHFTFLLFLGSPSLQCD